MKTALVLGAGGFIGGHMVKRLKSEGYWVRGVDKKLHEHEYSHADDFQLADLTLQSDVRNVIDQQFDEAKAGSSIVLELENDINVTRGDMIVKSGELPQVEKDINATICWMDSKKLVSGTKYLVQHNTNRVLAKIDAIKNVIATDYSGATPASQLAINEIGEVTIKLSKALYFDKYNDNKSNGAFILIDANTNTTAGVGFIN